MRNSKLSIFSVPSVFPRVPSVFPVSGNTKQGGKWRNDGNKYREKCVCSHVPTHLCFYKPIAFFFFFFSGEHTSFSPVTSFIFSWEQWEQWEHGVITPSAWEHFRLFWEHRVGTWEQIWEHRVGTRVLSGNKNLKRISICSFSCIALSFSAECSLTHFIS